MQRWGYESLSRHLLLPILFRDIIISLYPLYCGFRTNHIPLMPSLWGKPLKNNMFAGLVKGARPCVKETLAEGQNTHINKKRGKGSLQKVS